MSFDCSCEENRTVSGIKKFNRRHFFKSSTAALVGSRAVPDIISSAALGYQSLPPASDRIGLAFIGPGNRGRGLIKEFAARLDVEVMAVADVILSPNATSNRTAICDYFEDF